MLLFCWCLRSFWKLIFSLWKCRTMAARWGKTCGNVEHSLQNYNRVIISVSPWDSDSFHQVNLPVTIVWFAFFPTFLTGFRSLDLSFLFLLCLTIGMKFDSSRKNYPVAWCESENKLSEKILLQEDGEK